MINLHITHCPRRLLDGFLLLLSSELIIARMRPLIVLGLACVFFASPANAVRELVIIEEPQSAQRVEGVVLDPNGDPIAGMTVTDRADGCQVVLRSTKTDSKGHFRFPIQHGKTVYCLRFDDPLWNPLQMKLKLDKHAPEREIKARPEIGG